MMAPLLGEINKTGAADHPAETCVPRSPFTPRSHSSPVSPDAYPSKKVANCWCGSRFRRRVRMEAVCAKRFPAALRMTVVPDQSGRGVRLGKRNTVVPVREGKSHVFRTRWQAISEGGGAEKAAVPSASSLPCLRRLPGSPESSQGDPQHGKTRIC